MESHKASQNNAFQQARILVVDDERDLVELLEYNLTAAGHRVTTAFDGAAAVEAVTADPPDIIILDLMMPGLPGTEVLRRLRANPRTARIPVVMLTARAAEEDELVGLSMGADDYITKPFSVQVVLARVENVLRRSAGAVGPTKTIEVGPVALDLSAHAATADGAPLHLTPTEYRLLLALARAAGQTLTRGELVEHGMGPGIAVTDRVIDVHIAAVRRKLGPHANMVRTVRGVGYRLLEPESAAAADRAGDRDTDDASTP